MNTKEAIRAMLNGEKVVSSSMCGRSLYSVWDEERGKFRYDDGSTVNIDIHLAPWKIFVEPPEKIEADEIAYFELSSGDIRMCRVGSKRFDVREADTSYKRIHL